MPTAASPMLLVLDGNSLMHRAYHAAATGHHLDQAGRPVWAIKGLVGYIARAAARLRPDAIVVGFDCPDHSARKVEYPAYKAHRAEKPAELVEQIVGAPDLLRASGLCAVVATEYEADDVLASSAASARRRGWRCVLVTSDRDAFALIDDTTSLLRVRNGGLDKAVVMTATSVAEMCGVQPSQYRDYAALRGDPSDNLPGVPRLGAATSAKLIAALGNLDAVWAALDSGDGAAVRSVVGGEAFECLSSPATRQAVNRNRDLMLMRVDLPMPDLDTTRLPINLVLMRRALAERGIHLGPSLWALTGGSPPVTDEDLVLMPRPWVWRRSRVGRRPAPGQLALF